MPHRDLSTETDAELLGRYTAGRDEGAFAELVRRYGPTVFGVTRRILANDDDADDAFQATFLALAKAAKRVERHAAIAGWIHQTATRCARSMQRSNRQWALKN